MSILFALLFLAAIVGIFKPYISGSKRSHFAIAAVVCFILVGVFAPQTANGPDQSSPGDATAAVGNSAAPVAAAGTAETQSSKWTYSNSRDEMRGTTSRHASILSENEVDLEFPYGEVRGEIWVRKRPEDGLNVAFQVTEGQVLCHSFSDSYVSIKFDDGPVQKFSCIGTSDGSSETAFIENEERVLAGLNRAKRTIVEAEFFQQGRKQFVFDTDGLEWK